jgi:hypothetical protein
VPSRIGIGASRSIRTSNVVSLMAGTPSVDARVLTGVSAHVARVRLGEAPRIDTDGDDRPACLRPVT